MESSNYTEWYNEVNALPNILPNTLPNNTLLEISPSYPHQQLHPQWAEQSTFTQQTQQAQQAGDESDNFARCLVNFSK
jgi:hypothetical protein